MKVILLQDVAKIGRRFEEANVPDGYAMNMLIPKGMAQVATPENRKKVAAKKANQAAAQSAGDEAYQEAVTALTTEPLALVAEANEQGHLFKAIKPEEIVEAAKERGLTLVKEQIKIQTPIKSVGSHGVMLASHDANTVVTIEVTAK